MPLYNLPNATDGIDNIIKETITAVPSLSPLLLLFTFFTIFLGGIARQKVKANQVDYPIWAVVASLSTFLLALIMSVSSGFIRLDWLVIVIGVTIMSAVWFFLDRKQSEI